jgi:hypothetical protein
MSFHSPAYGMHWGFVKPYPCTHGCVRMPLNSARNVFDMVSVGTPVHVATSQPWDSTIGARLPRLDDSPLPDPPMSYMLSPQVFQDAERGKMWNSRRSNVSRTLRFRHYRARRSSDLGLSDL